MENKIVLLSNTYIFNVFSLYADHIGATKHRGTLMLFLFWGECETPFPMDNSERHNSSSFWQNLVHVASRKNWHNNLGHLTLHPKRNSVSFVFKLQARRFINNLFFLQMKTHFNDLQFRFTLGYYISVDACPYQSGFIQHLGPIHYIKQLKSN